MHSLQPEASAESDLEDDIEESAAA